MPTEPLELREADDSVLTIEPRPKGVLLGIRDCDEDDFRYFYATPEQWARVTEGEWLPIESAPEGQWVWLYFPRTPSSHDQSIRQSVGIQTERGWWCTAGGGAGGRCDEGFEPSHWRPLPPPPSTALGEK